jgi:hypothetical protein
LLLRLSEVLDLSAGVFGLGVWFWEVGVGVFQHFVLVAVAELAGEGAVLGAALVVGVGSVVFHCTFADGFVRASRCGIGHWFLL